jgi:HEAT repeat protein
MVTNRPAPAQRAARALAKYVPDRLKEPLRRFYDPSRNFSRKLAALEALKSMGTNGASLVPAVEQVLRQNDVALSSAAAVALAQLGTNSVPVLIAALDDGDYNIRAPAGYALANLTTNAAPMNSIAFYALSRAGKAAVPSLMELVGSTNVPVRSRALSALAALGGVAEDARPVALEAFDDPAAEVRWRAVEALGAIDWRSPEAEAAFISSLSDPDPNVRAAGMTALSMRPRITRANFPKVFEMLRDPSPGVRGEAAFALGQTGQWGAEAIPILEGMTNDADSVVSTKAKRAIETIQNTQNIVNAKPTNPRVTQAE